MQEVEEALTAGGVLGGGLGLEHVECDDAGGWREGEEGCRASRLGLHLSWCDDRCPSLLCREISRGEGFEYCVKSEERI